jgi:hypothetical protein
MPKTPASNTQPGTPPPPMIKHHDGGFMNKKRWWCFAIISVIVLFWWYRRTALAKAPITIPILAPVNEPCEDKEGNQKPALHAEGFDETELTVLVSRCWLPVSLPKDHALWRSTLLGKDQDAWWYYLQTPDGRTVGPFGSPVGIELRLPQEFSIQATADGKVVKFWRPAR